MQQSHVRMGEGQALPVPAPEGNHEGHTVQFYEDAAFLCRTVADLLARALAGGRSALVIATEAHRDRLLDCLVADGVEVSRARLGGQLTLLDARDTLDDFLLDGEPDLERVRSVMGETLGRCIDCSEASSAFVYGEMVDLLWRAGSGDAAIRLEGLWNEISKEYPLSLLCGYAIEGFDDAADAAFLQSVCGLHDHVVPTERYTGLDGEGRLREIASLQQRARALETERSYRKRLERRLRRALAQAETASRAKSEFLAVMSHELRTPLNAIAGYADLMEMGVRGPITDAQREDLQRIQQSQRHLLGLINEVLNYTRLETGTLRYDMGDVPARSVLATAEELIAPQARAKGLELYVERPVRGLAVRADAEKLRQILTNLLSNAVKFTDEGGRVSVRSAISGETVLFHVSDTGIGIAPEMLEKIFEPFVQVRSDLMRTTGGTGLGLAISRDLARGMGGDLTAESAPGVGSTFILRIPRADPTEV